MPNEKIAQMMEDAPGQVSGMEDSLVQVDNQLAELQEQQDALQAVLEQIYSEIISFLSPLCDYVHQGLDFYPGTGIGNIDSNVENWRAFNLVPVPIVGQTYSDPTVYPIIQFICNNLDETVITSIETTSGATPEIPHYLLVLIDDRGVPTLPAPLVGDMSNHVIMWDGTIWSIYKDNTFVPYEEVIVDDASVEDKYAEFDFSIDSIHHPIGFTGTYGTKGNIEMINNGKVTLVANKDKLLDSRTKLARFGE